MAIVSVNPTFDDSGDEDESSERFSNSYDVICDSFTDDEYAVKAALPFAVGDAHHSGKAICIGRSAIREGQSTVWRCTIDYGPREGEDGSGSGGNDESTFPEIAILDHEMNIVRDHDYFGTELTNSAQQKFANGDEFGSNFTTIEITAKRPFDMVSLEMIEAWRNVVHGESLRRIQVNPIFVDNPIEFVTNIGGPFNPSLFGVWGGWRARLTNFGVRSERTTVGGKADTRVSVSLQITIADLWLGTALDEGTVALPTAPTGGSSNELVNGVWRSASRAPYLDTLGFMITEPAALDGRGKKLVDGGHIKWRVWQRHPHGDLTKLLKALDLPNDYKGYRFKGT